MNVEDAQTRATSVETSSKSAQLLRAHGYEITAAAVLTIYYLGLARYIPATGDEIWYLAAVRLLDTLSSQIFRLDGSAALQTLDQLVDRGWYMPGITLLVWPATWFTNSIELLRLYMAVLNFAVLRLILGALRGLFGARSQAVFLACTLPLPYYALYNFLIWGDLLGAQIFLLIILLLIRQIRDTKGQGISLRAGILFGLALGLVTYVRGFYWLAVPLLLVGIFVSSHSQTATALRLRHLAIVGGISIGAFFFVLSPWSMLVSLKFGPHITTTSLPVSQIVAFGSNDYVNSTGLPTGVSVFDHLHDHILRRSRETGATFRDQARDELAQATVETTLEDYLRAVLKNSEAYYLDSETFIERFRRTSKANTVHPAPAWIDGVYDALKTFNHGAWRLLLVGGVLLFMLPIGSDLDRIYLSTFFKYSVFLFSLQPLVVFTHGRYYVEYVPFIATAIAVAVVNERHLFEHRAAVTLDDWIIRSGQAIAVLFGTAFLSTVVALTWILPANG